MRRLPRPARWSGRSVCRHSGGYADGLRAAIQGAHRAPKRAARSFGQSPGPAPDCVTGAGSPHAMQRPMSSVVMCSLGAINAPAVAGRLHARFAAQTLGRHCGERQDHRAAVLHQWTPPRTGLTRRQRAHVNRSPRSGHHRTLTRNEKNPPAKPTRAPTTAAITPTVTIAPPSVVKARRGCCVRPQVPPPGGFRGSWY